MRSADFRTPARGRQHSPRAGSPASVRFGLALALLLAAGAVPLLLAASGSSRDQALAATPPYALPASAGRTLDGAEWDPTRDVHQASALIYVSDRCPYCRTELLNWAAVAKSGPVPPLWIVASPGSGIESLDWVPSALRRRVVWDDRGVIADSLGVRAVPATLWVDPVGVVRAQTLGASSPEVIRSGLRELARWPDGGSGTSASPGDPRVRGDGP